MSVSLVGREGLLAVLRRAVGVAAAGRGGLVFLTGEAGIGKTSVAAVVSDEARSAGALVAWGTCREGTAAPGLWAWREVLRDLADLVGWQQLATLAGGAAAGLASLAPESVGPTRVGGGQGTDRLVVFDAVASLLRRLASERPVLVVFDDLHWADPGTLRLLRFVAPDLPRARLLLLGAYRDDEVGADHPLRQLVTELAARAEKLPVGGLTRSEVGELLGRFGERAPDAAVVESVHRRTGGNPFLVLQLGGLAAVGAPLSGPAREAMQLRLERLPPGCRELLAAASVLGPVAGADLLARVAGVAEEDVRRDLAPAVAARILERLDAGSVRFAHDLFREHLYDAIEAPARARMHRRAAEALEATEPAGRPGLTAELADHRAASIPPGSAVEALGYVLRAAVDASGRLAFEEAASRYAVAAELAWSAGDAAGRRSALLEGAEACLRGGDLAEAEQRLLAVVGAARAAGDADGLARASLTLHRIGVSTGSSHADVGSVLEEALAARTEQLDAMAARLLGALCRTALFDLTTDDRDADGLSRHALDVARAAGDPATLAFCLLVRHDALWRPGTARQRLAVLAEAEQAAQHAADPALVCEAKLARFVALLELGDPGVHEALEELDRAAKAGRQPHFRWLALTRRTTLALLTGRFDEAAELIEEESALGDRLGEPDTANVAGTHRLALVSDRDGVAALYEAFRRLTPTGPQHSVLQLFVELGRARERGDHAAVAAIVRSRGEPLFGRARGWQGLVAQAGLVEPAVFGGALDVAERVYRRLLPHRQEMVVQAGAVDCDGPVSYYLGRLAGLLGQRDAAIGHLRDAVEHASRLGAWPWVAASRCELAALAGAGPEANQLLEQAEQAAADMGLADVGRRAAELRGGDQAAFQREGDVWTLRFRGTTVRLPDAKGLRDIARLLAVPGVEVAAAALVGDEAAYEATLGADEVLDARARQEYRSRLADLDRELDDAGVRGDPERAAEAEAERDALLQSLSAAYGLGGRPRRLGVGAERARKAVTMRIRDTLGRIEARHPALGQHLREAITTGTACAYRPAAPVRWTL